MSKNSILNLIAIVFILLIAIVIFHNVSELSFIQPIILIIPLLLLIPQTYSIINNRFDNKLSQLYRFEISIAVFLLSFIFIREQTQQEQVASENRKLEEKRIKAINDEQEKIVQQKKDSLLKAQKSRRDSVEFKEMIDKMLEEVKLDLLIKTKNAIRESCKDPESFDVLHDSVEETKNGYEVFIKYRAKNSFGAYVTNSKIAKYDKNAKFISIN